MSDTVDRVVVFMDYQNIYGWARRQSSRSEPTPAMGTSSRSRSANCSQSVGGVRAS